MVVTNNAASCIRQCCWRLTVEGARRIPKPTHVLFPVTAGWISAEDAEVGLFFLVLIQYLFLARHNEHPWNVVRN